MDQTHTVIGRAERVSFPRLGLKTIPARIDTGAKTSAIWASGIVEENGTLSFKLFGKRSEFYTGQVIHTKEYKQVIVANSTGHIEQRYAVKLVIKLQGRVIRATFTLANRATQVYPVLVGRNVLRGKFIVNVTLGKPHVSRERQRELEKQAGIRPAKLRKEKS